jgi:hypothetical protein
MMTRYLAAALLIITAIAFGDDFKTIDGKEYKNVTVDRVEPDGLIITHSVGRAKIPLTKLPKYLQEKYYRDRVAAAAADRAAAQAAEEKRREQKALDDKRVEEERAAEEKRHAEPKDDKRVKEERVAEEKRRALAIILGAVAVTVVVYLLVRGPKIELVPSKDDGEQQIVSPVPLPFALELCPVLDPGDQKLEKVGPLVAAGGG